MAEESFQERTEQATPKRREEARKKGQVAKSRELASVAVLLSGLFTLSWGSTFFYHHITDTLSYYLERFPGLEITSDNIDGLAMLAMKQFALMLVPLFLVLCAVAILSNYLQVGGLLSLEAIKPQASKISPLQGLKRLFSLQAMVEFMKSLLKLTIVGWIAYDTVRDETMNLLPLLDKEPIQILQYMGGVSFSLFLKTCMVMVILATLDFLFQKWEFEKNLRMTKQEVKEEFKQTEGDPHTKSRIRSIQREMAQKRMMAEVPKADVVITNPTHLAVALKYEAGRMEAPMVIAKGAGVIAEKIREIAKKNNVPVIENKPLAQSLYKLVDMGKPITENLYQAVAEVLAYVYRLKSKKRNTNTRGGIR